MLLNEKGLDFILVILMCSLKLFAIVTVPLVVPFAMLVRSMMPLAMLMRYMVPLAILLRPMVPLAVLIRSMVPLAMSMKFLFPCHVRASVVATVIPTTALVALHHFLVLLALGILLVPI